MPSVRDRGLFLFSLAVAVLAAWALLETRGWPIKTALYPRVVGIPLLLLAAAESVLSLRAGVPDQEQPIEVTLSSAEAPGVTARRTWVMTIWIGGFFAAVILLGFQVAVPLFVLAYIRAAKEGWVIAAVLALLAGMIFHLLFVSVLHLPLPIGLVLRALGR